MVRKFSGASGEESTPESRNGSDASLPSLITSVRQTDRQTDTAHTQTHCLIHHFAMRCHIICIHTNLLHLTHLTHSSSLSSLLSSSGIQKIDKPVHQYSGGHTHTHTLSYLLNLSLLTYLITLLPSLFLMTDPRDWQTCTTVFGSMPCNIISYANTHRVTGTHTHLTLPY